MSEWLVLDVETTGLDPRKHGVIEVGIAITDQRFNVLHTFQETFAPEEFHEIDAKAMEINGINLKDLQSKANAKIKYLQWIGSLPDGKRGLIGHNVERFDLPFMKQFDPHIMDRLDRDVLDTKIIANFLKIPNRSLTALYDLTGAPPVKAHRALNDCLRTIEVLKFFRRQCGFEY